MYSKFALSNLLLATAALAAPPSARLDRRQENHLPVNNVGSSARDAQNYDWNTKWAGIVVTSDPNPKISQSITAVTATFVVPALSRGSSDYGNQTSGFSIWAAIDGYSPGCAGGFLVGIDGTFTDGMASYDAWYYFQQRATPVSGSPFLINANDVITLMITTTFGLNWTTGEGSDEYVVIVENHTTGQLANPQYISTTGPRLCGKEAQWIAGVNVKNNNLPLADFGTVTFTDAMASSPGSSETYNPLDHSAIREIAHSKGGNETRLTYTNPGTDSLVIQYLSTKL